MPNTLEYPREIAEKNLPQINPWLIRTAIFVLGLVFVLTPFWAWYSDSKPNKAEIANSALLNKELERLNEVLSSDGRFERVKIYIFDKPVPSICLTGKLANEEDMYQLKDAVGFIRLKVKVTWMVVAATSKNNEAIP